MVSYTDITGKELNFTKDFREINKLRDCAIKACHLSNMKVGDRMDLGSFFQYAFFTRVTDNTWILELEGRQPLTLENLGDALASLAVVVFEGG